MNLSNIIQMKVVKIDSNKLLYVTDRYKKVRTFKHIRECALCYVLQRTCKHDLSDLDCEFMCIRELLYMLK